MNENQIKCMASTVAHIARVRELLALVVEDLLERSKNHDDSKLRDPELSVYAEHQDALATTKYGTPEYDELKKKVLPAIEHHYAKNRHHPEHHKNGVNDMTFWILWKCSLIGLRHQREPKTAIFATRWK